MARPSTHSLVGSEAGQAAVCSTSRTSEHKKNDIQFPSITLQFREFKDNRVHQTSFMETDVVDYKVNRTRKRVGRFASRFNNTGVPGPQTTGVVAPKGPPFVPNLNTMLRRPLVMPMGTHITSTGPLHIMHKQQST